MKRMAIISSYNESCGNASYTEVLRKEFSKYCDVDILSLPQGLLHGKYTRVVKKADEYIDDMCSKLREYDYINVQFESGLFGNTRKEIIRRFSKIVANSNNIIVTMHRVDLPGAVITKNVIKLVLKLHLADAYRAAKHNHYTNLYVDVVNIVKKKGKYGSIIVHTKRERNNLNIVFGYENVSDFPITFLNAEKRKRTRTEEDRNNFLQSYGFDADDIVIGLFGFISEYKGTETAIKALNYLPSNYKIAIFGKQHPMSIQENTPIDNYLKSLIALVESQHIPLQDEFDIKIAAEIQANKVNNATEKDTIRKSMEEKLALSLDKRVRFEGELDDDQFIDALYGCDFAVLPYMETNQSGSGVAALVVETKVKSLFSNSKAFGELQQYYPNCFEMFDIGNYLELANKIKNYKVDYSANIDQCTTLYNIENNVRNHMSIFEEQASK